MQKTKQKTALQAIQGKIWVKASYKKDGEDAVVYDEDAWLSVKQFEEGVVPATVWFSAEKTLQVKQFEPLKISMGCSLPCYPEERVEALEEVVSTVENLFGPKFQKIKAKIGR
jgi:hypothetical protein